MPTPAPDLPPGSRVHIPGRGDPWVWDTGADRSAEGKPVLVLLHGLTSTAALNWCRCFPTLAAEFRVVALDQRGHGRGIRRRPVTLEACADDAAGLIEALGLGPVVAVGYSMGGPVAQLLWHRSPQLVRGLVLCSTAMGFGHLPTNPGRAATAVGTALSLSLTALPGRVRELALAQISRSRQDLAGMAPWAQAETLTGDPAAYLDLAVALGRFDSTGWIGGVEVPAGVVITEEDLTVPPARQHALAAAIPGADVWSIAAGHRACAEAPRPFNAALLAACRHVSSPTGLPDSLRA